MKKLLKIILFFIGVFLAVYGILLILLPFVGAKALCVITVVNKPFPALQDRLPGRDLFYVTYTYEGDEGRTVNGSSLRLYSASDAPVAGEAAGVLFISAVPQLNAPEDDTGFNLKNGILAGAGLLLAMLPLPWKRRKAPARIKASRRIKPPGSTWQKHQFCQACGKKLTLTAKYCTSCGIQDPFGMGSAGEALKEPNPTTQVQAPVKAVLFKRTIILCPRCTAPVRMGQNFCQECGESLRENQDESPASTTQAEGDSRPGFAADDADSGDMNTPAAAVRRDTRPPAKEIRKTRARSPKGKAARIFRIAAVLLLLAGITLGFIYHQQIVYAATHLYFDNQWRFAKNKAEDEKGIRTMLDGAAKAFESGDVAAACAFAFPPEEDRFRNLLDSQPGYMAAMAGYLGSIRQIRLGEAYTSAYGYSARPAEVTASLSGREFNIQLLKIGDTWYISGL